MTFINQFTIIVRCPICKEKVITDHNEKSRLPGQYAKEMDFEYFSHGSIEGYMCKKCYQNLKDIRATNEDLVNTFFRSIEEEK